MTLQMQGGKWTPALPANRFFVTLTLPSPVKGEGVFFWPRMAVCEPRGRLLRERAFSSRWHGRTLSPRGRGQGEGGCRREPRAAFEPRRPGGAGRHVVRVPAAVEFNDQLHPQPAKIGRSERLRRKTFPTTVQSG